MGGVCAPRSWPVNGPKFSQQLIAALAVVEAATSPCNFRRPYVAAVAGSAAGWPCSRRVSAAATSQSLPQSSFIPTSSSPEGIVVAEAADPTAGMLARQQQLWGLQTVPIKDFQHFTSSSLDRSCGDRGGRPHSRHVCAATAAVGAAAAPQGLPQAEFGCGGG